MDFEKLLSGYKCKACIMSVDRLPDDRYGNIRIVAGNQAHCDDMIATIHREFIPGSPYEDYFPQDKNFEDFCYRSALLGQPLHTYINLHYMNLWLNLILLPLDSDKEGTGYCLYAYEVAPKADSEKMASLSADTASAVLQTCIKLRGSENIRETMNDVIADIRGICESDHCCILLVDKEARECSKFSESIKPGSSIKSIDYYIQNDFYSIAETWPATIGGSTCIIIKNQQDKEWLESVNPVWYNSLTGAGINNIVLFPLDNNGNTIGYLWAFNFNEEETVKIKETLELTTYFIASEIANYQLLNKLEKLSSIDMLTGVKNRNAMNNTIDDIVGGKSNLKAPYSVIFADLNGLKRVNDKNGHLEGDKLLKTAANVLCSIFTDADVFRAGGDEFLILLSGVDEQMLAPKLQRLEEQAERDNVHFAVGTSTVSGDGDIRTAMHIADEKMYEDKKAFYDKHPELKYRAN